MFNKMPSQNIEMNHLSVADMRRRSSKKKSVGYNGKKASGPRLRCRVVILEDERIVAETLKMFLEDRGLEVAAITASGPETINAVEQFEPDLLIMDIRVQGEMDGIQTALIIQQTAPKSIPIIFLTAHEAKHFSHLSRLHPSSFVYLTKPYGDDELLSAIVKILGAAED